MKTTTCLKRIAALSLLLFAGCTIADSKEEVKGNGTLVTRTIPVGNYTEVSLGENIESKRNLLGMTKQPARFNYTQTTGASTLEVTTDENLFSEMSIEVKGDRLTIKTKDSDTRLYPTTLTINGSSAELTKVNIVGVINFVAEGKVTASALKASVSGVGDVNFDQLDCQALSCNVSGVGDITIKGKAQKADYHVSGVGDVCAYGCVAEQAECHVSGVGGVEVYATQTLKAHVSGVGSVKYKGEAKVESHTSGVGGVKRAD